jgi:hypothetical protein
MIFLIIASSAVVTEAKETGVPIEIIRLERGASSKEISGAVIRGARSLYSIDARSGQRLSVGISAAEDNAVFQIYGPGRARSGAIMAGRFLEAKRFPGPGRETM